MKVMLFDTETNGLPIDKKATLSRDNLDNWPRVIELAWLLVDSIDESDVSEGDYLIQPDGWEVPAEDFWLSKGLTTQLCLDAGVPIKAALEWFLDDMQQADVLVSHNFVFDRSVTGAECIRAGLSSTHKPFKICTKEQTVQYCKMKYHPKQRHYPGAKYRWPRLEELWAVMFGKDTLVQEHRAMGDVRVLKTCFFELVRRHVIKLPLIAEP